MKKVLVIFFVLQVLTVSAQVKHDANWVFGYNAGIDFNDPSNPVTFKADCNNDEYAGSISDASGRMLFYLANPEIPFSTSFNSSYANILDREGNMLVNGDSIMLHTSCTNGASIVPSLSDTSVYWILHLGLESCFTSAPVCFKLYYTKVKRTASDSLIVLEKNVLTTNFLVGESMAITKNAEGNAWWLFLHENFACSNTFHRYQVTDTISYLGFQDVGGDNCSTGSGSGEMKFDRDGTSLVRANYGDQYVELLSFDRCSGLLSNHVVVETGLGQAYGCEFSPSGKFLYVTFTENIDDNLHNGLYQYSLHTGSYLDRSTIWDTTDVWVPSPFQLELAPDGSIMFSLTTGASIFGQLGVTYPHYMNLSRIAQPDSLGLACQFEEAVFPLGDSARSSRSLPHYPNYNLGPLPVFTATAGGDTVQCNSGSGITLGVPAVSNVLYQWSSSSTLNNTSIAQPVATPTEDTWYYLTATDTTATSCAVATDSVFIQVVNCVGIEEEILSGISLYPNPANNKLQIELPKELTAASITVFDLLGVIRKREVLQQHTQLDISELPAGVYIYQIEYKGGAVTGKLLVE